MGSLKLLIQHFSKAAPHLSNDCEDNFLERCRAFAYFVIEVQGTPYNPLGFYPDPVRFFVFYKILETKQGQIVFIITEKPFELLGNKEVKDRFYKTFCVRFVHGYYPLNRDTSTQAGFGDKNKVSRFGGFLKGGAA